MTALESPAPGDRRSRWAVLLLTAGLLLPFLGKAYHIDDWVFLRGAQLFREHGLGFLQQTAGFMGAPARVEQVGHPPGLFVYLAGWIGWTGVEREWLVHLAVLPFPLLAAAGIFTLARRYTRHPVWATVLLVGSPAFLVNATNVMADVPTLAGFLWSLIFFQRWVETGRLGWGAAALACGAGAFLTSYQALVLLPIAGAYVWTRRQGWGAALAFAAGSLVILAGFLVLIAASTSQFHLTEALSWVGQNRPLALRGMLPKTAGLATTVGGCLLFPLPFWCYWRRGAGAGRWYLLALGLAWGFLWIVARRYPLPGQVLFLLLATNGLFLLGWLGERTFREWGDGDRRFLAAWLFGYLLAAWILLPYGISRYYLYALVPLVLLGTDPLAATLRSPGTRAILAAVTVGFGVWIAVADAAYAAAYRHLPHYLARTHGAGPPGYWLRGEWGFRWYMEERLEADYLLTETDRLPAGDLLVRPATAAPYRLHPALARRLLRLETVVLPNRWGAATMFPAGGAGFYTNENGLLPWTLTRQAFDRVLVYRAIDPGPFLDRFGPEMVIEGDRQAMHVGTLDIFGDRRQAVIGPIPSTLVFHVEPDRPAFLEFFATVFPTGWTLPGAVTFTVAVTDPAGSLLQEQSYYADPAANREDRRWVGGRIPLLGQEPEAPRGPVRVRLQVAAAAPAGRSAAWAGLWVVDANGRPVAATVTAPADG